MIMRRVALVFCAAMLSFGFRTEAFGKGKIVEFDPPGANVSAVSSNALNNNGDVIVTSPPNHPNAHAFIRKADGEFVQIGAEYADVIITGVNDNEETTGSVFADGKRPGFVGAADGSVKTFLAPGTDGTGLGTQPQAINRGGDVAGYYSDNGSLAVHGFFRSRKGHVVTFDAPNAGTGDDQGTFVTAMNAKGAIAGYFIDGNGFLQGFVRSPDGNLTTIDIVGEPTPHETVIYCMNDKGVVGGYYLDEISRRHGFLRDSAGTVTTVDIVDGHDPYILGVNNSGEATGYYHDAVSIYYGFIRHRNGKIKSLLTRDSGQAGGLGTISESINDTGEVGGTYVDSNHDPHSFLRLP